MEKQLRWRESKREKEKESNPALAQSPMIVNVLLMSKQSLGKAMNKVKNALPQSPRRKKVVVRALATSLNLIQQKKKKKKNSVTLIIYKHSIIGKILVDLCQESRM